MSDPVMRTFVWHGNLVFRVSTIDRDSSSPYAPGRYAETMAWEWLDGKRAGLLVGQDEGPEGDLEAHFRMCRALRENGTPPNGEGDEDD